MNRSWEIIGSSFIEAFKWSKWKWIFGTSISSIVGFLIIGEKYFKFDILKSSFFSLGFVVFIFIVRWAIIIIKNISKLLHEFYTNSKYGDAIIILKDCFAEIHYYRKTEGFQEEEFMKSMILFCNNLKIIFDKITTSNCSVSIKVPVGQDKVTEVTALKNLTRDTSHKSRDTKEYIESKHTIIGNTAFNNTLNNVITNKNDKYYINNAINRTANYLNTSKQFYENEKLPYNSELVHSISPKKSLDSSNYDCHGFVCIDSDVENAFDEKYCPAIIEGVCDGIYDLILELNKNKNGNNN